MRVTRLLGTAVLAWVLTGCGSDDSSTPGATSAGGSGGAAGSAGAGGAAAAGGSGGAVCPTFAAGDENGHADPYGAKAAGQARAGRIASEADIVQPAHGRQKVRVGDYVLANEHVAFVIESEGPSDGYATFGGELLMVDRVGDDGRPLGNSRYVETLVGISIEMIDPESITVLNDGSDGNAAVVRVIGPLTPIPFLNGALGALFSRRYGFHAAYDYVLEPGEEKLSLRLGMVNSGTDTANFSLDEIYGFFQLNHNQFFTREAGFGSPTGGLPWAGYVSEDASFAWRLPGDRDISGGAEISGFQYFTGPGFTAEPCVETWNDHAEIISGKAEADGLLEVIRRVDGEPEWRPVAGSVQDSGGTAVGGAWVHVEDASGTYLSRTRAGADGSYRVHVPPGVTSRLVAQAPGHALGAGQNVDAGQGSGELTQDLALEAHGSIQFTVTDLDSAAALPVRIQVIPEVQPPEIPEAYGVEGEARDRLHQIFSMSGSETVAVPPGRHRVIISRGFEWEIVDQTVDVAAGAVVPVAAALERSVDSTGTMCADFHIHSKQSADSSDDIVRKVQGAIADGLEIPVSSEHEWVIDFQPVVEELGMSAWAHGFASSELTTFSWGHFGVVPLTPRPDALNNGAVDWVGLDPADVFAAVDALPEQPFLIVNHPSGGGFGAYLSSVGFDRDTGVGSKTDLWSDNFDALEVFNASGLDNNRDDSVGDWFAMLNHGRTVWAVGSSDSHGIRTKPVGYPRTCLPFGHDDPTQLSPNGLAGALRTGGTFISGGIFLEVTGPGGEGPGETVSGAATQTFTVKVQTPSWVNATDLEVIVDGETVLETALVADGGPPTTGSKFTNSVQVPFSATADRSWVVFHVRGAGDLAPVHPGRDPFAVSNPIFYEN